MMMMKRLAIMMMNPMTLMMIAVLILMKGAIPTAAKVVGFCARTLVGPGPSSFYTIKC